MRVLKWLLVVVVVIVGYLLLWPVPFEPQDWTPPPAPGFEGDYAYNEKLKDIERLVPGFGVGPEAVAVDATGRIYSGYIDGRVIMLDRNGKNPQVLANTGGRPLGVSFGPNGGIVVADAMRGLLLVGSESEEEEREREMAAAAGGKSEAEREEEEEEEARERGGASPNVYFLSDTADGVPFRFTDDVDNTQFDKNLYFTDASSKFGPKRMMADFLEHGANGRLLRYNVVTQQTEVLASGLHFANGVAVGPDDAYVLVNETAEYRVMRYWLKGEKAGTLEPFIENLPGFPDNITYNGRDRFWLALYGPRSSDLDGMMPNHFLRKLAYRLPKALQPKPAKHSLVLGLDLNGKVVANLQYKGDDAYAPITSVREYRGTLYFGSLSEPAIGRIALPRVMGP